MSPTGETINPEVFRVNIMNAAWGYPEGLPFVYQLIRNDGKVAYAIAPNDVMLTADNFVFCFYHPKEDLTK